MAFGSMSSRERNVRLSLRFGSLCVNRLCMCIDSSWNETQTASGNVSYRTCCTVRAWGRAQSLRYRAAACVRSGCRAWAPFSRPLYLWPFFPEMLFRSLKFTVLYIPLLYLKQKGGQKERSHTQNSRPSSRPACNRACAARAREVPSPFSSMMYSLSYERDVASKLSSTCRRHRTAPCCNKWKHPIKCLRRRSHRQSLRAGS